MVFDKLGELALALDEGVHLVVGHGFHELHVHFLVLLEQVHHLLDALLDDFQDGFVGVHLRLLLQVAYGIARSPDDFAAIGFLHTGDDLEEGGLAGAVQTDDADLGAVEEGKVNVLEDDFVVVREDLAHARHREYYLFVCHSVQN